MGSIMIYFGKKLGGGISNFRGESLAWMKQAWMKPCVVSTKSASILCHPLTTEFMKHVIV
jgi:hypothetical protein